MPRSGRRRTRRALIHDCLSLPKRPMAKQSPASASQNPLNSLWKAYNDQTSDRLKFIDVFLFFLMLSGIIQFAYCVLVTTYPYNAFLAGCVLLCSLRLSLTFDVQFREYCRSIRSGGFSPIPGQPSEQERVQGRLPRAVREVSAFFTIQLSRTNRAFADFALGSIVLHFFVYNFLG